MTFLNLKKYFNEKIQPILKDVLKEEHERRLSLPHHKQDSERRPRASSNRVFFITNETDKSE